MNGNGDAAFVKIDALAAPVLNLSHAKSNRRRRARPVRETLVRKVNQEVVIH